jgi:hypothetical protein
LPDYGLNEALANALKSTKGADFVRAPEMQAAAQASKLAGKDVPAGAPAAAPEAIQAPPIDPDAPQLNVPQPATPDPATLVPTPPDAPPPVDPQGPPPVDPTAPPPGVTPANPDVPSALPDDAATGQTAVEAAGTPPAPGTPNAVPPPAEPALGPIEASARRFVSANVGDFDGKLNLSHMPNTDTISTPEGLKASLLQVADDNKDAINAARRGTITNEQLLASAQDLVVNTDVLHTVLQRELGTQLVNGETVLAARLIGVNLLGETGAAAGPIVDGTAASADVLEYARREQLFLKYQTQLQGAMAEQGRATNAMGIQAGLPTAVADHVASVIRNTDMSLEARATAVQLANTPVGVANIISGGLPLRALKASYSLLQRVFINGILSGPPTWVRIFIGNNFNLVKNGLDILNAGMTRGAIGVAQRMGRFPSSAEGAQMSDAFTYTHGVISAGMDAFRAANRTMATGVSMDGLLRFNSSETSGLKNVDPSLGVTQSVLPEITGTWFGALMHGIDNVIDFPGSRVIGAVDEFTKTLGARGYRTMMTMREIRSQLQDGTLKPGDEGVIAKNMFENPSPEMQQAEEDWAHRQTFQTPFPEGGFGQGFTSLIENKLPALKFVFPFMRTSSNIFKQSMVEGGPLAVLSTRLRNQLKAGGFEADMARGRIVTAMQFAGGLAWMAIHDQMTGEAPKDPKERALWEQDGRLPNAMKITNPTTGETSWRSYASFEPVASWASAIGCAASAYSRIHQDEELDSMKDHADMLLDMQAHIVGCIIANFANKSTMLGAAKFSEMFADPEKGFAGYASDLGQSMIPYSKATEFVRNTTDPYLRNAFTLYDKIVDNGPLAMMGDSRQLGVATDLFGNPRMGSGPMGRMSPFPSSPVGADNVTDELNALMDHTHTVPITMPSKQVNMGGGSGKGILGGSGLPLTSQEYSEMVQKGRAEPNFDGGTLNLHDKLAQVMQSPTYMDSTPAERASMVSLYATQADKIGRDRLYTENDDFRQRMTAWAAQKNGIKAGQ